MKKRHLLNILAIVSGVMLFSCQEIVFAAQDLKTISTNVTEQVRSIASLLVIVAYVAGVGFALAGIVQFKAHKDNPTQVPLSKPIVYLIIGACLLFLPTITSSAGQTIFGGDKKSGGDFKSTDIIN